MMKLYRIIALIIGSAFFIPISCTVVTIAGVPVISWLDTRNVERGDTVHSLFSAVAELKNDRDKIIVLNLKEIAQPEKPQSPVSFIMSKPSGSFIIGRSKYTYKVLENKGDKQVIEVVNMYRDGDNTIWSRYRATENNIFPLTSRMFYFGYVFQAMIAGIIFSIIFYLIGKFLKGHSAKLCEQRIVSE